jgi:hypothetical protein
VLADVRFQEEGGFSTQLDESDPRKLKVIKEFNKRLLEAKRKNANAGL